MAHNYHNNIQKYKLVGMWLGRWFSGMTLTSGARGPKFNSWVFLRGVCSQLLPQNSRPPHPPDPPNSVKKPNRGKIPKHILTLLRRGRSFNCTWNSAVTTPVGTPLQTDIARQKQIFVRGTLRQSKAGKNPKMHPSLCCIHDANLTDGCILENLHHECTKVKDAFWVFPALLSHDAHTSAWSLP